MKGPKGLPLKLRSGIKGASLVGRLATSPLRSLPDFLIIGAQKCGTTSLYNYLAEHPNVVPAYRKEIHFFDYNQAKGDLWYRAHFPVAASMKKRRGGPGLVSGEASPFYLFHPLASERVRRTVPEARLVVMLRDPVQRAYSHYSHNLRRGTESLSFEEAIERERERLAGERERMVRDEGYYAHNYRVYSYLSRGIYVDQLRHWRTFFPEGQFLFLKSEDFFSAPAATVESVARFLGLPSKGSGSYKNYNQGGYKGMAASTRERLVDYFRPHNERLYEYLDRDFGWER